MKTFLSLISLLMCWYTNAQSITISGKVTDIEKKPLQDVTVFLSKTKDSSLISYTATDIAGIYELKLEAVKEPSFITYDITGYQPKKINFEQLLHSKKMETIELEEISDELSEIVIITDAPIRVKNDTIEYNVSSFKVRPDANVETLLKELPGVVIDQDKKITVNGKEVSQILVNGKPFFDKDGNIALQNLPAEIIKKVQVSDFKTKAEEFSGKKPKSDNASINLTIDEKNNKGLMGKLMGGIGTDSRYETSGLLNYFQGDRKISILASSNNINSTGFSMDEIFDNMGGGRSQIFSIGGRSGGLFGFGRSSGITKSHIAGFNYTDQFSKNLGFNTNYYINNTNNENATRSRSEILMPEGIFITESQSEQSNTNTNHNAGMELEYKINENTQIFISPSFSANDNTFTSSSSSISTNENGENYNSNKENSFAETKSNSFSNSITFNKNLDKNGKNISLILTNNNEVTNGQGLTKSETIFVQDTQNNDIRNQKDISRNTYDTYQATLNYTQPITQTSSLEMGYSIKLSKSKDEISTLDYNKNTQNYTDFNSRLSNTVTTEEVANKAFVGYRLENDKYNLNIESGANIQNLYAKALYMQQDFVQDRKFLSPYVDARFQYSFTRSKYAELSYGYDVSNPKALQLLPYERLNNPLNTYIGNPNLDQDKMHWAKIRFRNYNFQMRSGWSISLSANYYDSKIVSYTTFDENKKRTTSYKNVSGSYEYSLFGDWNKSYKWDEHSLRYGIGAWNTYNRSIEYVNSQLVTAQILSLSPRIYINYDYGDLVSIAPSYGIEVSHSNYKNTTIASTKTLKHNLMIQTTTYWPKNWTFGNDFSYTYNTNLGADFKNNYFLWNTALSYGFLDNTLIAKIKVYDLLNQNQGISRTISSTSITDQENTVLKRYAMFSLTWKFDKFGTKNNENRRMMRRPQMFREL